MSTGGFQYNNIQKRIGKPTHNDRRRQETFNEERSGSEINKSDSKNDRMSDADYKPKQTKTVRKSPNDCLKESKKHELMNPWRRKITKRTFPLKTGDTK